MPSKAQKRKIDEISEKENLKVEQGERKETATAEMNIARRAFTSSKHWVGVHVSAAKGPKNAVINAHDIGCNSFALFLKNQRTWNYTPYVPKAIDEFKEHMNLYSFDNKQVLPHGSYLINLGNPDKEKRKKSYDAFLDDLKRCEQLGIELYNFHPGSTVGECTAQESIELISECINDAIAETSTVTVVIENMAGQGNIIGSKFEELAEIIKRVSDKRRVGVCIDTCHAFAAGYDLRTKESFKKVFDSFDAIVGREYLKALHLNDSKGALGCKTDRHENLGKGKIGIECFRLIMNDERFTNMPIVLETPPDAKNEKGAYADEVKLLYSLIDKI